MRLDKPAFILFYVIYFFILLQMPVAVTHDRACYIVLRFQAYWECMLLVA